MRMRPRISPLGFGGSAANKNPHFSPRGGKKLVEKNATDLTGRGSSSILVRFPITAIPTPSVLKSG